MHFSFVFCMTWCCCIDVCSRGGWAVPCAEELTSWGADKLTFEALMCRFTTIIKRPSLFSAFCPRVIGKWYVLMLLWDSNFIFVLITTKWQNKNQNKSDREDESNNIFIQTERSVLYLFRGELEIEFLLSDLEFVQISHKFHQFFSTESLHILLRTKSDQNQQKANSTRQWRSNKGKLLASRNRSPPEPESKNEISPVVKLKSLPIPHIQKTRRHKRLYLGSLDTVSLDLCSNVFVVLR